MPSLIMLCAAPRRPSGVRNAFERAVPMSVPPYQSRSASALFYSTAGRAYLAKPAADIVPTDADDVAAFEAAPAGVVARTVLEQRAITEAEMSREARVADLDLHAGDERRHGRGVLDGRIPAHETLIALAHYPRLTTSASPRRVSARACDVPRGRT
jgi:hypothetical protein